MLLSPVGEDSGRGVFVTAAKGLKVGKGLARRTGTGVVVTSLVLSGREVGVEVSVRVADGVTVGVAVSVKAVGTAVGSGVGISG